jgi:hypothetical protein
MTAFTRHTNGPYPDPVHSVVPYYFKIIFNIVMDLIDVLPGNSFVNTNTGNSRGEIVFYAVRAGLARGAVGSLLPGNEAVNMHPQQ